MRTIISRPSGKVRDFSTKPETVTSIDPQDWPCGDNDPATSYAPAPPPYYYFGDTSGASGFTTAGESYWGEVDTGVTRPGTEAVPADAVLVAPQRVKYIYTSDYPVSAWLLTYSDKDEAHSTSDAPSGVQQEASFEIAGVIDPLIPAYGSYGELAFGATGAPSTYRVTVHEWWIETDIEGDPVITEPIYDPILIDAALSADVLGVDARFN